MTFTLTSKATTEPVSGSARLCLGALLCALACSDVTLKTPPEPPKPPHDDRMSLAGRFCTDVPKPLEFPLRVLFIVDTSQSMNVTDPAPPTCNAMMCLTRRGQAVLDVLNAYPGGNGVEYALMGFSSDNTVYTQDTTGASGFTADSDSVKTKLPIFNTSTGETNYEGALDSAYKLLQRDMIKLDARSRSRARYVVIFMSDGLPSPVTPDSNTPDRIHERVNNIKGLEREQRLAEIKLHTVFLSGGLVPSQIDLIAKDLLADMARLGGGTMHAFFPGEMITFFYLDFTAFIRVFALKSFFVSNQNARLKSSVTEPDSDGDGLLDSDEVVIGTSPLLPDTDGDGFNDLLEVRLRDAGFNPLFPGDADCRTNDPENRKDEDGDGLLNCEERFIGTSPRLPDSDADGLRDDEEHKLGTNPVANDLLTDIDFDGARNGLEVRCHTDPNHDDAALFSKNAYRYDIQEVRDGTTPKGQLCYDFTVDNITLAPTLDRSKALGALTDPGDCRRAGGAMRGQCTAPPTGTNTILLHMVAAPLDAPDDYGNHRVACVRPILHLTPDLKLPPSGHMTLKPEHFKLLVGDPASTDVIDLDRDCLKP